jgi:type IV secretion system protein VirB11
MRQRPDRILVGEVRSGYVASELLKVWNTGHPGGAATIHANDARTALERLESLYAEVTSAPVQRTIASAINIVIQMTRTPFGRRLKEVVAVHGFENGRYITSDMEG